MIKVNLGNQSFILPESWDDVISSGRYLDVVGILAMAPSGSSEDIAIRYYIYEKVLFLYADGALEVTDIPGQLIVPASQLLIDECYPVLKFIFNTYCTSCPMPEIMHKGIAYRGKGAHMLPMNGKEMEDCAWAYAEYTKTGDIKMLDTIIAILYKPKWRYIPRWRWQGIETLPPLTKMAVKFWYESCEAWWYKRYQKLYEKAGQADSKPDSLTVSRLLRGLAGVKRGTVDQVRKIDRDEIYFELMELDREREEMEELTPK